MTRAPGVTAIVLAGGRSTRFGSQKLEAEFEGRPLLEHAIAALADVAGTIIVAGAPVPDPTPGNARGPALRTVPDARPFEGPLAGLSGALGATTAGMALVVGGDMPGLVPDVLRAMIERLAADEASDAVLLAGPTDAPRRQVLPLAIDVPRASSAAIVALEAGDRSLVRFLDRLRVITIPAADWLVLDPAGRTLLDVDLPDDVARIRDELRRTPFGEAR